MTNVKKLLSSLNHLERKVLPYLKEGITPDELVQLSQLKEVEVSRALQWLANKKLVSVHEQAEKLIVLGENGELYKKSMLPERRLLTYFKRKKSASLSELQTKIQLEKDELSAAIGVLRKKAAVFISKEGKEIQVKLLPQGEKLLGEQFLEELLLLREFPLSEKDLEAEEKFAFNELKKRRNILKQEVKKHKRVQITDLGASLLDEPMVHESLIETLTSDILRQKQWKTKKFRRYDVTSDVKKVYPGKKQHYRAFLDMIRQRFLSLGFQEMQGPLIEQVFWNMDALYMPQFHSARDIHDVYYIEDRANCTPPSPKLIQAVKKTHEQGHTSGSKGWQYPFDVATTKQMIMRSQGTALSARKLADKKLQIPGKYFGIARCFRYDVIDATHLPDFNQVEGIVIEEGATFGHLKGLLQLFAEKFAETDQVSIRPAYFPFTEPSAELFAKHPELGWIELGGAGIFRPEVTKPLGVETPVLAWGLGIDRIAMFKLGIKDIRELFSHDLANLRSAGGRY